MARPRKHVDTAEVVRLRRLRLSWNVIARRMGLGRGTVVRAYQSAATTLQLSQNPKVSILRAAGYQLFRGKASLPGVPLESAQNVSTFRLTGLENASFRN
jgi:hypothetical protein